MTRTELVNTKVEELENNGKVVVDVVYSDGQKQSIEMADDMSEVIGVITVSTEQYEANSYEVDGLEAEYVEF